VRCASDGACVRLPAGAIGVVPDLVAAISAYVRRFGDGVRGEAEVCPCNVGDAVSVGSLAVVGEPAVGLARETVIVSPVGRLENGSGGAGGRMLASSGLAGSGGGRASWPG
jgi:hypothetical protein